MADYKFRDVVVPEAGVIYLVERSSDPTTPPDGVAAVWLSDGTGTGNDGEVLIRANKAGTLHTNVLAGGAGTVGTNVTAVEFSNGIDHLTRLTLSSVAATIGDNASLAGGALIYTLPAGPCVVESASISVGMTLTTGTPTTDTPEIGLGTVIASGAVAVLGGTATFENIMAGASTPVLADVAGTAKAFTHVPNLKIETADAHTIHINYADAWADVDNTAATISGTVVLRWTQLPLS